MKHIYEAGMTLIELLIAMVIASFLMAGVFNVYLSIYSSDTLNDELSVLQQNGRFAIEAISKDVRMAGFTGCTAESTRLVNLVGSGQVGGFKKDLGKIAKESASEADNSLVGWNAKDTDHGETVPAYTAGTANVDSTGLSNGDGSLALNIKIAPNSDMLRVWGAKGKTVRATDISSGVITLSDEDIIKANQYVAVSNCEQKSVIAKVCAATSDTITLSNTCNASFGGGLILDEGDIVEIFSNVYYVSRVDGRELPSLFRMSLGSDGNYSTPQELAEGVESMQILYGLNTDEDDVATHLKKYDVDVYVSADAIKSSDWKNIVSIQVSLLLASVGDNASPNKIQYSYNGANKQSPNDNRLRRTYTKTIALRNRAL